jgi:hypothetical protein
MFSPIMGDDKCNRKFSDLRDLYTPNRTLTERDRTDRTPFRGHHH